MTVGDLNLRWDVLLDYAMREAHLDGQAGYPFDDDFADEVKEAVRAGIEDEICSRIAEVAKHSCLRAALAIPSDETVLIKPLNADDCMAYLNISHMYPPMVNMADSKQKLNSVYGKAAAEKRETRDYKIPVDL